MRQILRRDEPVVSDEGFPRGEDSFFAVGGEGYVRGAGVAAVEGPFGFAVSDYEDSGGGRRHVSLIWVGSDESEDDRGNGEGRCSLRLLWWVWLVCCERGSLGPQV